jgi:hypothetical protein
VVGRIEGGEIDHFPCYPEEERVIRIFYCIFEKI